VTHNYLSKGKILTAILVVRQDFWYPDIKSFMKL